MESSQWEQTARFLMGIIRQYVKTIKCIDQSRGLSGAFSRTVLDIGYVNS
jgi:hypothetical protein